MTDQLSMGVLGYGPIAQLTRFESTAKARNTRLYALCDRATDLVERMATVHQPETTYAEFNDMLSDYKIDAVIIACADQFHVPLFHVPLSIRALEAGKHVLVEKPMGVTVAECQMLCDAVERSGLTLQVGHMK